MKTAFALSGGGSRGDFQVGALRYLYDHGITPDYICGTSVGSINGAKIAEGEGSADQGLRGLEAIWLGMRMNSDMWLDEPWLNSIPPKMKEFLLKEQVSAQDVADLVVSLAVSAGSIVGVVDATSNLLDQLQKAKSLYNLDPVAWKLRGSAAHKVTKQLDIAKVQGWSQAGARKLRLAVVSLESGRLRYVTEDGKLLERDGTTTVFTQQALAPECESIAAAVKSLEGAITGLQESLAPASGGEKPFIAGQIKQKYGEVLQKSDELATCNVQHPPQLVPVSVDLASGVLASASIPAMFGAVTIGDETYVDGGVREVVPIQAALDLGADTVYAIVASESGVPFKAGFGQGELRGTLLHVVARALVIAIDEVQVSDMLLALASGQSLKVIQPSLTIHDIKLINPALIRISMAYGFMRAGDVMETSSKATFDGARALSDAITQLRLKSYEQETLYFYAEPIAGIGLDLIRARKRSIRDAVKQRIGQGLSIPTHVERAWLNWEWPSHLGDPTATPWDAAASPVDAASAVTTVPSTCQHFADEIATLEATQQVLQDELGVAAASKKATLITKIKAIDTQITQKTAALASCVQEHTPARPAPATDVGSYGVLVKGTGPKVFVIYGGSKLWIRSPAVMTDMGYQWDDIQTMPDVPLERLPEDMPADGSLLRSKASPKVYVMRDGMRCWVVSPKVLDDNAPAWGNSWADIRLIPDDTLNAIPAGADVTG